MKNSLALVLVAALVAVFGIASCGADEQSQAQGGQAAQKDGQAAQKDGQAAQKDGQVEQGLLPAASQQRTTLSNRDKINFFLSGLGELPAGQEMDVMSGDPEELPPYTVDDPSAPSGKVTYNCTTTPYEMSRNPDKIVTLNPDVGKLWLGSMLQGSGYAGGLGSLKALPMGDRAPLKVYMDLLNPKVTRTVDAPDAASMQEAIGGLATEAEQKGKDLPNVAAFQQTDVSTTKQGLLELGFSANYIGGKASGKLDISNEQQTSTVMASFQQRYFTVSYVTPPTPADYFTSDATISDFREQRNLGRVGVGNPPVVVSSISYGRIFLMTISSRTTQEKLSATLNAAFSMAGNGGEIELTAEQKEILQNSTFDVISNGGNEAAFLEAVKTRKIDAFLEKPSKPTSARPISYQVDNISSGSAAAFTETTKYNLTTCSAQSNRLETVGEIWKLSNLSVTSLRCDQNMYGNILINNENVVHIADKDPYLKLSKHIPQALTAKPEGPLAPVEQISWPKYIPPDPSKFGLNPDDFESDGYYLTVLYRGLVPPSAAVFNIDAGLSNALWVPWRETTTNTYRATETYPFTQGRRTIPGNSPKCPMDLTYELVKVRDLKEFVP